MTHSRRVTLVAAAATLLGTAPLSTVYATWTWAIDCLFTVGTVCLTALGVRALRAPAWAQVLAMLGALTGIATWLFGRDDAIAGLIPTGTTFGHFGQLLTSAVRDLHDGAVPLPDRVGLLFLTSVCVGLVAVFTDLVAVVLRRPALAGFPMVAMYSIAVLVHRASVSFIPFAAAVTGFLWLLASDNLDRVRRFGRRLTSEEHDVDPWQPSPLAAAGRRLAAVGVLLAILLPLAVPRMSGKLLDSVPGGPGPGTGPGSATVDLFATLTGRLNLPRPYDMVTVTTAEPGPDYLRFGVADNLTDTGFTRYRPSIGQPVTSVLPTPTIAGLTTTAYQASVDIIRLDMPMLPIYAPISKVRGLDSSWLYDPSGDVVYSDHSPSNNQRYTFDYVRSAATPALDAARALASDHRIQRTYTQLPSRPQLVDTTVAELKAATTTPYATVQKIHRYFSTENRFRYALSTRSGTTGSDIADFLTNRQGFCVQYAAAMAWLVRAAGIPARVAFGFKGAAKRVATTYTMTTTNLHAWTEVYFDGFGWVPFDATPAPIPQRFAGPVSPARVPDVHDNSNSGARTGGTDVAAKAPTWPYYLLGSVAPILALLVLPALGRIAIRRRRARTPTRAKPDLASVQLDMAPGQLRRVAAATDAARHDAHAAWDELVDTLIDYQIATDPAETPRATAERLIGTLHLPAPAAEDLRRLAQAEEHARYARTPLPAHGLGRALHTARTAIAQNARWQTRLRAVLLPPSALRHWRLALASRRSSDQDRRAHWAGAPATQTAAMLVTPATTAA